MADADHGELEAKRRALQARYEAHLPGKLAEIRELWGRWRDQGHLPAQAEALHKECHSLAGSGASFGFPEISQRARTVEQLLRGHCLEHPPDTQVLQSLDEALQALVSSLVTATGGTDA